MADSKKPEEKKEPSKEVAKQNDDIFNVAKAIAGAKPPKP